mmetsp:Transcript_7854/g.13503  ORF Transcript_7854/g.13503 Transcript_7854/m.13503 type:complete len:475 (+) Transcript_7854:108-1532(+)
MSSYLDARKRSSAVSGANGAKSPASSGSERSSPSAQQRDRLLAEANGVGSSVVNGSAPTSHAPPGLSQLGLSKLSSSARMSPQTSQTRAAAGARMASPVTRPTRTSTPGDLKSQSMNASNNSSAVHQALRHSPSGPGERKSSQDRTRPTPLDFGVRRALGAGFKAAAPAAGAQQLGRSSSSRPAPQDMEHVIGDLVLSYGQSTFQGQRDYQEDTLAAVTTPGGPLAVGVFDGHGGDEVSKELEKVLLQNMTTRIAHALARDPDNPGAVQAAIHDSYMHTNEDIARRVDKSQEAGSCAVTVVVQRVLGKNYLFCANAGDCRAVLYSQTAGGMRRATRLSEDHKPHPNVCPSEITRICDAGGCVLWGRVQGCLAVSRAFGDRTLQPYVISNPYLSCRALDPDTDLFFYLASDGVTDMVDDQAGCAVVAEQLSRGASPAQAAASLVSFAYQKGSCDNISVMVVRLRRRQVGGLSQSH